MKNVLFHQGDVQGMSLSSLPSTAKKAEKNPIALGEMSGHQHVVLGDYEQYVDTEDPGTTYIAVGPNGAILTHHHKSNFCGYDAKIAPPHADHMNLNLSEGIYALGIGQQYDPFAKEMRRVAD